MEDAGGAGEGSGVVVVAVVVGCMTVTVEGGECSATT